MTRKEWGIVAALVVPMLVALVGVWWSARPSSSERQLAEINKLGFEVCMADRSEQDPIVLFERCIEEWPLPHE
jgi:hypothetical protein